MFDILKFIFSLVFSRKVILSVCLFLIFCCIILPPLTYFLIRNVLKKEKKKRGNQLTVGIFHPYANAGGGGEKVLWVAVEAMQHKYPQARFYIYTGDRQFAEDILRKVQENLNVNIAANQISFIYLTKRKWVEPTRYPVFTMLGQILGSISLGFEALFLLAPDIFIETSGFTFTLPMFKYLAGSKIASYVHYPMISAEMLRRVQFGREMYNNRGRIRRTPVFSVTKLVYYHALAQLYSLAGRCSDTILVNSTFTLDRLQPMWNRYMSLVYPPCEVQHLKSISRDTKKPTHFRIMSLAQFRPEKNHALQLQALYELREIIPEHVFENVSLVLCGSCRNPEDSARQKDLVDLSKYLSLENHVTFKVNIPYSAVMEEFAQSYIGIHTMLDEHFGISVVEQMAAGLIVVAHKSGGPLLDIIETAEGARTGFLADTPADFAHALKTIIEARDEDLNEIRERARASCDLFSLKNFTDEFLRAIDPLFK